MIIWKYMLVAAILLVVFVFYNEWKRKNKSFLYARLTASLLAIASLLFMAYPSAENKDDSAIKKIVLITDGFIKDSVENFLQQSNSAIPVFSTDVIQTKFSGNNSIQLITDFAAFANKHKDDTIHVFGNGLSKEALELINQHPIVFHASTAFPGISHIYWKQYLETGEPLIVQGHYENSTGIKIKIILQSFGATKDSIEIDSLKDFILNTIPQHRGRAIFSIIAIAGKDTLEKEPIPVEVQTAAPLQLLIISSSPDFENTFLKNQLSQQGYRITTSTIVSTNKTNKQFLNVPQQQSNRLTVDYLNKFDVLVADEEALQKISADELASIRSVIADKGTGLLLKIDQQKNTSAFYSRFFPVKELQNDKQSFMLLRCTVSDSSKYKIKMNDPLNIEYVPGTQTILQDDQSNIYVSGIVYGSGKIIATTLQNTYSMALAGDKTSYQKLWWLLLNKAAKKICSNESWRTNSLLPCVNHSVQLETENNNASLPSTHLNETSIYLNQDSLLPFQWRGKYWPSKIGWQQFPQLNRQAGLWYVYKESDWWPLRQLNLLNETKKYAALHPASFINQSGQKTASFFVNRAFFMLVIFLVSCIFLWVEQKKG